MSVILCLLLAHIIIIRFALMSPSVPALPRSRALIRSVQIEHGFLHQELFQVNMRWRGRRTSACLHSWACRGIMNDKLLLVRIAYADASGLQGLHPAMSVAGRSERSRCLLSQLKAARKQVKATDGPARITIASGADCRHPPIPLE